MTTRTYGFARPVKYEDVKPGMLISADRYGQQIIGLAFNSDYDMHVAVFDQDGDGPELPYVVNLSDIHETSTIIDGEREFEPVGDDFALPERSRNLVEGFIITSDGVVGLTIRYQEFSVQQWKMLDFDTGADLKQGQTWVALPPSRLLILQPGRAERREVTIKAKPVTVK